MSDYYEMAEETLGGILGGVSNSIEIFATDRDVLDTLTRKPLIAPELLLKGARIFLCISEHKLNVYHTLLQLLISQFLRWFEKVMLDNCSYKVILNATDADSQLYFSKLAGTYVRHRRSYSQGRSSSMSISEQEEPIIKPEQFATLKEAVLLTPWGLQRIQKMPYYKSKGNKFSENF